MTPNVCYCLHFALLSQLFSLLFLLLNFESFCGRLKLLLVHHKKVTGTSLTEVRLCQNVLHSSDRAYVSLLINVFELVHLVGFVDDTITFFEMNQLIPWLKRVRRVYRLLHSWGLWWLLLCGLFALLDKSLFDLIG